MEVTKEEYWRSALVGDSESLAKIHESFVEAFQELPHPFEGVLSLIVDTFWELVAFEMASPEPVENPAGWADGQVLSWVTDRGLSDWDMYNSELKNFYQLRILLIHQAKSIGPASSKIFWRDARTPLLRRLAEAQLHDPKVRLLIRMNFSSLVLEVLQARTAVLMHTEATVRSMYPEIAVLTPAEFNRLFRQTGYRERELGAARQIAAEFAGGRCGLDISTVVKYSQPGRPRKSKQPS
jgi:hypothetical protein